jgi:hypothetical protein
LSTPQLAAAAAAAAATGVAARDGAAAHGRHEAGRGGRGRHAPAAQARDGCKRAVARDELAWADARRRLQAVHVLRVHAQQLARARERAQQAVRERGRQRGVATAVVVVVAGAAAAAALETVQQLRDGVEHLWLGAKNINVKHLLRVADARERWMCGATDRVVEAAG